MGDPVLKQDEGGYKFNYIDIATYEGYCISGPRKDGNDALYSGTVEIDDDCREEYWTEIRNLPDRSEDRSYKSPGKYSRG